MCALLNRHRISKGWGALSPEDGEVAAGVWVEELDQAGVPGDAYLELYRRAADARASAVSRGEQPPEFTASLLAGLWGGPNGLGAEMAERAGARALAAAPCPHCGGRGLIVVEVDGQRGVKSCRH